MNVSAIKKLSGLRTGANASEIANLGNQLGFALPDSYKTLLEFTDGLLLDNGLSIYPIDLVKERNETFEITTYCPDHLLIGDDSGGTGILISRIEIDPVVVKSGFGDLVPPYEIVAKTLSTWIEAGLVWVTYID